MPKVCRCPRQSRNRPGRRSSRPADSRDASVLPARAIPAASNHRGRRPGSRSRASARHGRITAVSARHRPIHARTTPGSAPRSSRHGSTPLASRTSGSTALVPEPTRSARPSQAVAACRVMEAATGDVGAAAGTGTAEAGHRRGVQPTPAMNCGRGRHRAIGRHDRKRQQSSSRSDRCRATAKAPASGCRPRPPVTACGARSVTGCGRASCSGAERRRGSRVANPGGNPENAPQFAAGCPLCRPGRGAAIPAALARASNPEPGAEPFVVSKARSPSSREAPRA